MPALRYSLLSATAKPDKSTVNVSVAPFHRRTCIWLSSVTSRTNASLGLVGEAADIIMPALLFPTEGALPSAPKVVPSNFANCGCGSPFSCQSKTAEDSPFCAGLSDTPATASLAPPLHDSVTVPAPNRVTAAPRMSAPSPVWRSWTCPSPPTRGALLPEATIPNTSSDAPDATATDDPEAAEGVPKGAP